MVATQQRLSLFFHGMRIAKPVVIIFDIRPYTPLIINLLF
ncbi:Uncharacterised protein [Klebsiella pneumoniae]|uniref:Uncharacterized protein n=1 Tax=Klebsiella pneumoniae TaxID=573 RepID=A0A2X3GZS4_KLEPN|nr:Uncharacterised protein [Klebsiella pneumoniae]